MAPLTGVTIRFDTHDDDLDYRSSVNVFVKNRLYNSLTPETNTDYISNWIAFHRYQDLNDLGDGRQNPYIAYGFDISDSLNGWDDPSSHEISLKLCSNAITADQIVFPVVALM